MTEAQPLDPVPVPWEKMQQLLARAMKDDAWRQELLTNPKTLIEHELGITIPPGVTIAIHEATPTTLHLVLPPRQLREVEVSDADLEQVNLFGTPKCWSGLDGCDTIPRHFICV